MNIVYFYIFTNVILNCISCKHIVIVTMCDSHMFPTKNLARLLIKNHYKVTYLVPEECKEIILKLGANHYVKDGWNSKIESSESLSFASEIVLRDVLKEKSEIAIKECISFLNSSNIKPDVIFADYFVAGVSTVAEYFDVPFAYFYFTMYDFPNETMHKSFLQAHFGFDDSVGITKFVSEAIWYSIFQFVGSGIQDTVNDIRSQLNLTDRFTSFPQLLSSYPVFTLLNSKYQRSFISPNIQSLGIVESNEEEDPLPENIQNFIDSSSKDILYVAFGSMLTPSNDQLEILIDYLGNQTDYEIIFARYPDGVAKSPNILSEKYIDQKAVLNNKHVKLFLSHCGLNSIIEAIEAETVLVCYPLWRDQFFSAFGTGEMGISVTINDTLSKQGINAAFHNVKSNYLHFFKRIQKEKELLLKMNGYEKIKNFVDQNGKRGTTRVHIKDPLSGLHISLIAAIVITSISLPLTICIGTCKFCWKSWHSGKRKKE